MKTWQALVGAVAIGLVAGIGVTTMEMFGKHELFFSEQYAVLAAKRETIQAQEREKRAGQSWPKAEVIGGPDHDFGSMEKFAKKSHIFRIKNVGDERLTLTAGRTTCKCTVSALNGEGFEPGEVAEITVEWTGQTMSSNPDFRQTVELHTNDPDQEILRLTLQGLVTETIRVLPEEVVVGQVSSNTGAEAEFRMYGFRSEKIDILETAFEEADLAENFAVAFEPLPEEEVEKEKGASCGLLAKVTLKSGLPLGPINQTIRIEAMVDKEVTLHVPVHGQVESDIIIASTPEFEPRKGVVRMGAVKKGHTAKVVLPLYIKGEHRHETKFSVGKIDPEGYLHVDIGSPQELNNGKTLKYLVTIEVPPGLEPINRLGSDLAKYGRIVLETTHPQTKQIPLDVKFSVE